MKKLLKYLLALGGMYVLLYILMGTLTLIDLITL